MHIHTFRLSFLHGSQSLAMIPPSVMLLVLSVDAIVPRVVRFPMPGQTMLVGHQVALFSPLLPPRKDGCDRRSECGYECT